MNKATLDSVCLGDVVENVDSLRIPLSSKQRKQRTGQYRYYGAQGVIDYIDDYIYDGLYLLIAEDGENLRSRKQPIAGLVEGRFWVNNHAHVVRANDRSDTQFLYYLINSIDISGYVTGSTQPKLNQANLHSIQLRIPEKSIQASISAFLGLLDEKIALNNRINDYLAASIKLIFRYWFVDLAPFMGESLKDSKIGQIPKTIDLVPLAELTKVITKGTTPTTLGYQFTESGINFVKGESILDSHEFDYGKFAHIDPEAHQALKRSVIEEGDLLFTIAGTLGRFALAESDMLPANANQAVGIIRPNQDLLAPEVLYSYFLAGWQNDFYAKNTQRAVQANLSLTTLKSLIVPVLTQSRRSEYESQIIPLVNAIKLNALETRQMAEMRDTLLPKLMSGEIDVSQVDLTQLNNHLCDC
ncbi:restriction endonuclease subunit S [Gordonibacter sp.]|uniref:restriction endonuclease subunit S n=1 Tax=Gordonibacter sp. TaxID=1968902 RepID=UPI002FC9CD68